MATISVSKEPKVLSASDNPMLIELATAASGSTESYALTKIKVNNGVTSGVDWVQIILITPFLKGVRFNSNSSPSAPTDFLSSGFTFIFTPTTFTNTEIAASLAEAMRTDPNIGTYYSIYVTGDTVYINSKIASQRFALATGTTVPQGNNIILASNYTKFTITPLSLGASKYQGDIESNYAMWMDLYVDSVPTTAPFKTDLPLSGMSFINTYKKNWQYGHNQVDFDLSTVLKSYTQPAPVPTGSTGFEGSFLGYFRNYKVQYGDYKSVGFANISLTISGFPNQLKTPKGFVSKKYAANGSLDYTATNSLMTYYSGGTNSRALPLTLSPTLKKVFIAQKREYIYFLNKVYNVSGTTSYNLTIDIDYEFIDNTTSTVTGQKTKAITASLLTTKDGLYRINVSPSEVGIDSSGYFSGNLVRAYTIRIKGNGTQIVNSKKFIIDEVQPAQGIELIWLNEFGGHDSYYFGGNIISGVDIDTQEMIKNVPYDFPQGFEYNSVYDTSLYNTYELSSSYVDENTMNWLKGLGKSNKIYRYDSVNSIIRYVTRDDFDWKKSTDSNNYVVTIKIKDTIFENNVSV
jgi:hypothetical protein